LKGLTQLFTIATNFLREVIAAVRDFSGEFHTVTGDRNEKVAKRESIAVRLTVSG
jgi:hypothetical protein